MKSKNYVFCLSWIALSITLLTLNTFGQNTFDGKSIELIAPDAGGRCVAGFGGDPTVKRISGLGSISVTDCAGASLGSITTAATVTVPRDPTTGYWCFKTSDPKVYVTYTVGSNTYNNLVWLANTDNSGFYNVKDFGALGNGYNPNGTANTSADDTSAIKNAITYVGAKMGGTLYFPEGVYRVGSTMVLPPGIILKGTTGMSVYTSQYYYSGSHRRSNSTIELVGESKSLFRIGECADHIKMENLTLRAGSSNNTIGVEAVGAYPANPNATVASSQEFDFENVAFDGFNKGMYFHAVDANKLWQIDYVNVDHCTFNYNKTAGIHIDSFNSDWEISSSFFNLPINGPEGNRIRGDGLIIERATTLQMNNTFGGGIDYSDAGRGGTFIKALFVGLLTITNSAAERLSESISYGKDPNTGTIWGSYSNILTIINSAFDGVNIHGRVNFVSTGNGYTAKSVNTGPGVRIYSTGDRFCMDLNANYDPTAPCGRDSSGVPYALNDVGFQGLGTIVFQSGQPAEKNTTTSQEIAAIPAKIKGDLDIKGNEREWDVSAVANSRPILSATVENDGILPLKPLVRMGHNPFVYDIIRDTRGWLTFSGTQSQPYRGFYFSGAPFQIASFTLSQITSSSFSLSQAGTMVYCSDCQRNTAPCTTGGSGALAILNGTPQWDCK